MFKLDIVILRMASWTSTSKYRADIERVNSLKRPSKVKTSMASVPSWVKYSQNRMNKNDSMISSVWVTSVWGHPRELECWFCKIWQHCSVFSRSMSNFFYRPEIVSGHVLRYEETPLWILWILRIQILSFLFFKKHASWEMENKIKT